MQTTKARSRSLEVPKRSSLKNMKDAAQTSRQLKMTELEYDTLLGSRTPRGRSSKVIVSRSPVSEVHKKRQSRVFELESQVSNLQEDLKKANERLDQSESWKRHAQREAEEAKKQLVVMNAKLEGSQRQLLELSASEDARHQQLCKLSQERDRAWESELDAVKKQYTIDSAAFVASMNEIQRLKLQLEMVKESEATWTKHAQVAHAEIERLKQDHAERMKIQVCEGNKLEEQDDDPETMTASDQLEQTRAEDIIHSPTNSLADDVEQGEELNSPKSEISEIVSVKQEDNKLQSALEIANFEKEAETQTTVHIQSAIKPNVPENEGHSMTIENSLLTSQQVLELELKANLIDKEATELQCVSEDENKENNQVATPIADTSSKKEALVLQQLEAAQAINSTMEVKLKRLQVQADQWRKAAEAAASILSTQGNDMIFKISAPLDKTHDPFSANISSPPFSEGTDEDLLNKRNTNMLKKIGSLWKKGPK